MVNRNQTTTVFNVDYMKVYHHDHQEMKVFIEWSKQKYEVEELNKSKSTGGKVHVFKELL